MLHHFHFLLQRLILGLQFHVDDFLLRYFFLQNFNLRLLCAVFSLKLYIALM
eukprot:UN06677